MPKPTARSWPVCTSRVGAAERSVLFASAFSKIWVVRTDMRATARPPRPNRPVERAESIGLRVTQLADLLGSSHAGGPQ